VVNPAYFQSFARAAQGRSLRRILDAVFRKKHGRPFALDEAGAIFRHILENSDGALSLRAVDFGARYSSEPDAFVSVVDCDLFASVSQIPSTISWRRAAASSKLHSFRSGAESRVAEFLHDLVKRLQRQSSLEPPLTSALKAFFETVLTKGLACYARHQSTRRNSFTMLRARLSMLPCYRGRAINKSVLDKHAWRVDGDRKAVGGRLLLRARRFAATVQPSRI